MSSQSQTYNGANQAQYRTNLAKLFGGPREIKMYNYTNDTYDTESLSAGLVLGVDGNSGEVKAFNSVKTNGQQHPVAVLADDYSVDAGETKTVAVAIRGTLRTDMLTFSRVGDSLTTKITSNRRVSEVLEDRFLLRTPDNGTNYDNSI